MNGNSQLEQIIERDGSVKAGDRIAYNGAGALTIQILPGIFTSGPLPQNLPAGVWEKDAMLLKTLRAESFWRAAVGIAVSKYASKGWEIESDIPLRRKRGHNLILNAGAGTQVGEARFTQLFVQAYLCTKAAVVEVARETKAWSSRIVGLHHLDPLRCLLTNDPETPVIYASHDGKWHELKWWQVGVFADMPDVTEANGGAGICAAEGAYPQIRKLAAIERYITDKITGERPLALHFVSGVGTKQLEEGINSAKTNAQQRGYGAFMGAIVIPTLDPGASVTIATVPLAELPDGFDRKQEFDIALLAYANNLGLDPQDLQPLTGQQLGAGAQSQVLDNKAKGRGLALLQKMYAQWLNEFVLDDTTVFSWYEKDLRDEGLEAANMKARAEWGAVLIDKGALTADQLTNILVDYGDLPSDYLVSDITQTGDVNDEEKPEMVDAEIEPQPIPEGGQPAAATPTSNAPARAAYTPSQTQGILNIVTQVKRGELGRGTAIQLLQTAYSMSNAEAVALLDADNPVEEVEEQAKEARKKPKVTSAMRRKADKLFELERDRARRLAQVVRERDE